jgi:hypothetical protein
LEQVKNLVRVLFAVLQDHPKTIPFGVILRVCEEANAGKSDGQH